MAAELPPLVELPRPIPGCAWRDREDGTCSHPRTYSPECWQEGAHASDCEPLRRVSVVLRGAS